MKNTTVSASKNIRFERAYNATLEYVSLTSAQAPCSKGCLKRWENLFHIITSHSKEAGKVSPIRLALDSLHWGIDHTGELEAVEAELVSALLDELQEGFDAVKRWRHDDEFTEMVTDTLMSVHPLGKTWRWVYTDSFFNYLRNRTLDTLFQKEVLTQNIDLSIASDYEIKFHTRVARTRQVWQAFEASLHRLLPEVVDWPVPKQRNERELLRIFKERYKVDFANHQRDFDNLMCFLNTLWFKAPRGLSSFLNIHTFSYELALGIWPNDTQEEMEKLFLNAVSQLAAHKSRAEKNSCFLFHYDCYKKQLCGSWLSAYISDLRENGLLTETNNKKISRALMEMSLDLV